MVTKTVAKYGKWESEISVEAATAGSLALTSPRSDFRTGRAFFLESKPTGAYSIVEALADGQLKYVLPEPWSASTIVYEYGGLPYAVLPSKEGENLQIIFSDSKKTSLNLLDVDAGTVKTFVQEAHLRWADFGSHPNPAEHPWVLGIQEDHSNPEPKDVKDYIVLINVKTGEVKRLVEGADFYKYPRFSPDGKKVSWIEYDHPDLPFKNSKLYWADFSDDDGTIGKPELVAGEGGQVVGETSWAPDGTLYFTQEKADSNYRLLYCIKPGEKEQPLKLKGLENVEIGDASFFIGVQSFVFLSEKSMILTYCDNGAYNTVHVDLETEEWTDLDIPLPDMRFDVLSALSPTSFLIIGSGYATAQAAYRYDLDSKLKATATKLRSSTTQSFPSDIFSVPEHLEVHSKHDPKRTIHGFFWPPHNPKFTAPDGTLPPLIVNPHGGPTAHTPPGVKMIAQFWTSRGFAYFSINYTGSSGHGKAYREALYRQWGILDRDDVPECIDHLASTGRVDRARVGIEGASAGGYCVLSSLVWHPDVFAGGISLCGVSDVKTLDEKTHKLELHYLESLLFGPDDTDEAERERIFRDRSPIFHAERVTAPLLLIHGEADTVVPIAQSYDIKRKIEERGGDVDMLVLPGEGHMFKKVENLKMYLEAEVKWWAKTLLKE